MTLGLFTSAIEIIDTTSMVFLLRASVTLGIFYTFIPWLYDEPQKTNDEANEQLTFAKTSSSLTEIRITAINKKNFRFNPDVDIHELSIQSEACNYEVSSDESSKFVSIVFNSNNDNHDLIRVQSYPRTKSISANSEQHNMHNLQYPNCINSSSNESLGNFQIIYEQNHNSSNYQTYAGNEKAAEEVMPRQIYKHNRKSSNYQTYTDNRKAAEEVVPRQKIVKPPRAHPPSRKNLQKLNACQFPSSSSSSSDKSFASVQTQTVDHIDYPVSSNKQLNKSDNSKRISKFTENHQEIVVNNIHNRSLYPEVNILVHGSESSTFPFSSSANADQEVNVRSKNLKEGNQNIESTQRRTLRRKSVKFLNERNCYTSSESCDNSLKPSRWKKILNFYRNHKDHQMMKSKSTISSDLERTPTGHSTPIERSNNLSEASQGFSADAFRSDLEQKDQSNQSDHLSRHSKVLLLTRGIPTCIIQDLNLIHEKSKRKSMTTSTVSETLSSNYSKYQLQETKNVTNTNRTDFSVIGHNNDNNNNYGSNSNYNNYKNLWNPELNKDIEKSIVGIRKLIRVPRIHENLQNSSRKESIHIDTNNNNNNNNNNNDDNNNNNNRNHNNESSMNCSNWRANSTSTLNKSHSLIFLRSELHSGKKSTSLPDIKDKRHFSRWPNLFSF